MKSITTHIHALSPLLLCCAFCGSGVGKSYSQNSVKGEEIVFSSPFQRALRRGLAPDGDLDDELETLRDYKVRSKKDAKAIVDALSRIPDTDIKTSGYKSPLYTLVGLFQNVDGRDAPAFEVLSDAGTSELTRIFDELKNEPSDDVKDDLLFLLRVLALYGTRDGAERVVEAARIPLNPEGYLWSVILSGFGDGHPERDFAFRSLSNPLPPDFIAVCLLDSANQEAIEGRLKDHPFDSQQGGAQLTQWLTSRNPDDFSYAHSATAALPFLSESVRNELLGLAREHTDTGVRIEAAWSSAKLGQKIGLQMLRDYCLDINHSSTAIRYLTELDREDIVPSEAMEPEFQAKAEFANWLSHPNELGRPPDDLETIDHRKMYWPPAKEETPLWLIKYQLKGKWGLEADDVECGLVGSGTWCFFSYKMHQRPPEDCYAIHCYWELGLEESGIDDAEEYEATLKQWPHGPLSNIELSHVVEIPPELKYGRRLVAVAEATMNNEKGWAVLDGTDGLWYPDSAMPEDEYAGAVLRVHVGRKLLGFPPANNRSRNLEHIPKQPSPEAVVAAYDRLLTECVEGNLDRKATLLNDWDSPMIANSLRYADSCESIGRESRSLGLVRVFMTLLDAISTLPEAVKSKAYDRFSLAEQFGTFIDSMVEVERAAELPALVALLEPHWDHNAGYLRLGSIAYQGEDFTNAERLILKLPEPLKDWHRAEEMSLLARMWHQQGKSQEASQLLVDCLQGLVKEVKESEYSSDRKMFEEEYQNHRKTYLELFPNDVEKLKQLGLPASALKCN